MRVTTTSMLLIAMLTTALPAAAVGEGDMNCDGVVDDADCPAMALAMTDPTGYTSAYPSCSIDRADINGDGIIDCADFPQFVALVTATTPGGCGLMDCPLAPFGAFAVADGPNNEDTPATACQPTTGICLVVWQERGTATNGISGRFAGHGGTAFGDVFELSSGVDWLADPKVAFDADRNRFLVVWSQTYQNTWTDNDIWGRFVPLTGPDPTEQPFTIGYTTNNEKEPSLALADGADEFLVVWTSETATGKRIEGRRVPADGSGPLAGEFVITEGPEERCQPSLAWDRHNDRYILAYVRDDAGNGDIWLQRMLYSGSQLGEETGIAAWPGDEGAPAIGVLRGAWVAVWHGGAEVYARWIGVDGLPVGGPLQLTGGPAYSQYPSVSCHENGNVCWVVWKQFNTLTEAATRTVSPNGSLGPIEQVRIPPPPLGWDVASVDVDIAIDRPLIVWSQDGPLDWNVLAQVLPGVIFGDGFESGNVMWWEQD